jgi:predicted porin
MKKLNKARAMFVMAGVAAMMTSAYAQTSVKLYGTLDGSVGSFNSPGGTASTQVSSGAMTTSFIGFSGSEDLGGGLSAKFALETFLRVDDGKSGRGPDIPGLLDTFWARQAFVGLSGNFGSVGVGRQSSPLFISTLLFNAFGPSFGFSPSTRHYYVSPTVTGDTEWSNSVSYQSPNVGGLSASMLYAFGERNGGNNIGANLLYFAGPFAATVVYESVKKNQTTLFDTSSDDTKIWQLGASYDFGAAKVFAQYGQVKNETVPNKFKISGVSAVVPVGAGKVLAAYSQVNPDIGLKQTTYSLAYDYNLSKRTDVYVAAMVDKQGPSATSYAVGIRHQF